MPDLNELSEQTIEWGKQKGIIPGSTPLAQTGKTVEEVHELVTAAAKLGTIQILQSIIEEAEEGSDDSSLLANLILAIDSLERAYREELLDSIGDVDVTLDMVANLAGLDRGECKAHAYGVISKRTGRMNGKGQFEKDE